MADKYASMGEAVGAAMRHNARLAAEAAAARTPTPHELNLLRDIADGEVWQHSNGESVTEVIHPNRDLATLRVTADVARLRNAGWARVVELRHGSRQWQLTDLGRVALDNAGRGR